VEIASHTYAQNQIAEITIGENKLATFLACAPMHVVATPTSCLGTELESLKGKPQKSQAEPLSNKLNQNTGHNHLQTTHRWKA